MTRQNKCDVCRKAKIKCTEELPRCSACVRRGKDCTRNYRDAKKDVRFVQVQGEVIDGAAGVFATRTQTLKIPKSSLPTSRTARDDSRVVGTMTAPVYLQLPLLNSEQYSLLARWTAMMSRDMEDVGIAAMNTPWCFKNWTISVPRYIGTSMALDDAMKCYLDCKLAFANPTDTNLLAVQTSKFKAIHSIRLSLESKGSPRVQTNILLAVQLVYMVEALMMHSHSTMVTHVKGLTSLLNEYRKNHEVSDAEGEMIFSALFISAYTSGLVPALLKGEDHDLDSTDSYHYQLPPSRLPVPPQSTQEAWQTMAQRYVTIPRLARFIRELQASPENEISELEVVNLAQHLYETTIDPNFLPEASSLGQIWEVPTTFSEIADAIPTSYGFKSRKLAALLVMYWMSRLLICGLVDKFISTLPTTAEFFGAHAVEAEDEHLAIEALKMVQYGFTLPFDVESDTVRIQQLQVLSLLQLAFGSWHRMEKRAITSMQAGGEETESEIQLARSMKQLCLDLGNKLMGGMQLPLLTPSSMEVVSEMFAGGPLVQCDLPEI